LKKGHTKSCGCLNKETPANFIDLTNNKYGRLLVIERAENKILKNGKILVMWVCQCECGNSAKVQGRCLRDKTTFSCGCLNESIIASELKYLYVNNYSGIDEYKVFINPETKRPLPYDIYIPAGFDKKLNGVYIEVHGLQHYKFIPHYHVTINGFKNQKKKDKMKRKFAHKNGIYIEIDLRKIKTTEKAVEYIEKILKENDVKKPTVARTH